MGKISSVVTIDAVIFGLNPPKKDSSTSEYEEDQLNLLSLS